MSIYPVTSIEACRIVGLDRDRFNEHVAAGHYTCAPKTVSGRTRMFTADDMHPLRLFKEWLDKGVSAELAGAIACECIDYAKEHKSKNPVFVVYVEFDMGSSFPLLLSDIDDDGTYDGRTVRSAFLVNVSSPFTDGDAVDEDPPILPVPTFERGRAAKYAEKLAGK